MLFNSYFFIFFFLPSTLLIFFYIGKHSILGASLYLSVISLLFYALNSSAKEIILLCTSIIFNFLSGMGIIYLNNKKSETAKYLVITSVITNLLALFYYKYALFTLRIFGVNTTLLDIALPLGISFFTFTQIAYLVDIYKKEVNDYNPLHYFLFVTYFPHLIAGPILHHKEMVPQFMNKEQFQFKFTNLSLGLSIFTVGLIKKLLFADSIAPLADKIFNYAQSGADLSCFDAWIGALAYTMQIYFDFSAYSDMAIGISKMFGFDLPVNFNSPYKSSSIIDFWRRWHITLSRFLRDYLYIPLGGNKKGSIRRYKNLLITMLLGGLWHGADWTFLIWGGLHGTYLIINHIWRVYFSPLPKLLGVLLTFSAVVFAWVFFRADNISAAMHIITAMLGINAVATYKFLALGSAEYLQMELVACLMFLAFFLPNLQYIFKYKLEISRPDIYSYIQWRPNLYYAFATGIMLTIAILMIGGQSPFLYFRF